VWPDILATRTGACHGGPPRNGCAPIPEEIRRRGTCLSWRPGRGMEGTGVGPVFATSGSVDIRGSRGWHGQCRTALDREIPGQERLNVFGGLSTGRRRSSTNRTSPVQCSCRLFGPHPDGLDGRLLGPAGLHQGLHQERQKRESNLGSREQNLSSPCRRPSSDRRSVGGLARRTTGRHRGDGSGGDRTLVPSLKGQAYRRGQSEFLESPLRSQESPKGRANSTWQRRTNG
jgi:hypothetical protein